MGRQSKISYLALSYIPMQFEKVCMDHASTVELLQAQLLNTRLECAATLRETEKRTVRKEEGAFTKVKLSLPRSEPQM